MCRIITEIRTLDQHFLTLYSNPSIYRPACCDQCGCSGLWSHGVYYRKGDRSFIGSYRHEEIPIPRFRCPHCDSTCSRLPACLAPRRWYPWSLQALALLLLFTDCSPSRAGDWVGVHLSTVKRWRDGLQERNEEFAFHLRSLFPSLGRNGEGDAFWSSSLRSMGLSEMMAAVCSLGVVVP
jgi:transposase-like protein